MHKFWSYISKKILTPSAVIFTVIYFLILCFANLTSETEQAITLKNSAVIYLFSLFLSSCDLIFDHRKIKFALKVVLHFFAVFISTVIVSALAGYDFGYRAYLMIMIYVLAYAMICPLYILIGKKYPKN